MDFDLLKFHFFIKITFFNNANSHLKLILFLTIFNKKLFSYFDKFAQIIYNLIYVQSKILKLHYKFSQYTNYFKFPRFL